MILSSCKSDIGVRFFSSLLICSLIFVIHATSQSNNDQKFMTGIDKAFAEAYKPFDQKQYSIAIDQFLAYNLLDTSMGNYESYSFLAESYKQVGHVDSGLTVLGKAIQKAETFLSRPKANSLDTLKYDSLLSWKNIYLRFPEILMKENGFVPYDEQPTVVHQEQPSQDGLKQGYQGTCELEGLMDEQGSVIRVWVRKSAGDILDHASIEALYKWKFTPGKRKGKTVKLYFAVPFKFKINE